MTIVVDRHDWIAGMLLELLSVAASCEAKLEHTLVRDSLAFGRDFPGITRRTAVPEQELAFLAHDRWGEHVSVVKLAFFSEREDGAFGIAFPILGREPGLQFGWDLCGSDSC